MDLNTPVKLISAVTDEITEKSPYKITQDMVPTTIIADALDGSEEVDIYFSVDAGKNWTVLQVDGSPVALTATDNAKTFYGPMMIGVTKDATVAACGVYAATANK